MVGQETARTLGLSRVTLYRDLILSAAKAKEVRIRSEINILAKGGFIQPHIAEVSALKPTLSDGLDADAYGVGIVTITLFESFDSLCVTGLTAVA